MLERARWSTGTILICSALIFVLTIGLPEIPAVNAQGSCHLRELDLCAATLLVFTQAPGGLASSEPEIQRQCNHLREANSCMRNYTRRCLTPIQREVVYFATNSSFKLMDEYCTKGSKLQASYLKHSKCLNQISRNEQKGCLRDLQAALEILTTNGKGSGGSLQINEHGKRLQLACCTYKRFESCLGSQMEKRCGKEAIEFVQGVIRRVTSRLPETMCRQYKPETPECRALLPKSGTVPKGSKSNSIISRLLSAYSGL